MKTAAVFTLGCRLNQADSALLCDRLNRMGYTLMEPGSAGQLDLLIINSCTVTGTAAQKSRQAAHKFRKQHPGALIIVTGCSAEIDRDCWQRENCVDVILTNPEKRRLSELVTDYLNGQPTHSGMALSLGQPPEVFRERAAGRFPFRSRAFVKIQEGCNNFCSYCIVPYARGPERSRDAAEVLAECRQLIDRHFPEIVLTGVNVCAYHDHGKTLSRLLDELCALPGDFRIRLSSTEPHPDNMTLLETMSRQARLCRFLHLSLQHGSNAILRAMNRHYTAEEYAEFVQRARQLLPDIHIGTDVIVGFPGETEKYFLESCALIEQLRFANTHIFSYSPRRGTPAATMPDQVPSPAVKERYDYLKKITDRQKREFAAGQLGKTLPVIFERTDRDGLAVGWSDNYLQIHAAAVPLRRIVPVTIAGDSENLLGIPCRS